jgi:hypothetical protein
MIFGISTVASIYQIKKGNYHVVLFWLAELLLLLLFSKDTSELKVWPLYIFSDHALDHYLPSCPKVIIYIHL